MRIRKSIFILSVFAMFLPSLAGAYPAELPRTGQSSCYANGVNVDCAGTGQDGELQAGAAWPDPRFTDQGDGTVIDNLTGLVWAKDANLMTTHDPEFDTDYAAAMYGQYANDGKVTWQHALDYIKKLNSENYLGYSGWRLPNVNELGSLVHAGMYKPALPAHPFINVQNFGYWSSTSSAPWPVQWRASAVLIVDMDYGSIFYDLKSEPYSLVSPYYVWPVRSGQCGSSGDSAICLPKTGQTTCYNSFGFPIICWGTGQDGETQAGAAWPYPRFTVNGAAVTDKLTGLVWPKNANLMTTRDPAFDTDFYESSPDESPNDGQVSWQHALDYIKKLNSENYLGCSDWRLPNRSELLSLRNYAVPLSLAHNPFFNVEPGLFNRNNGSLRLINLERGYWSSTTVAPGYGAWDMIIKLGMLSNDSKGISLFVWPVRSGQGGN